MTAVPCSWRWQFELERYDARTWHSLPGAKQRTQRVCNWRVNSSHLVSKVQRGVTSILGDRNVKNNQSQQETEWLKSLIVCKPHPHPIRSRCPLNISLRLAGLTSRGVWLVSRLLSSARCQTEAHTSWNTSYYDSWRRDGCLSSSPPKSPLCKPCACLANILG